jgi:diguanylate cyclase (GGDEF)-like protein
MRQYLTSEQLLRRVVTVSIGVATHVPGDKRTPESLVGAADEALYVAKRAGRNRVEVAS